MIAWICRSRLKTFLVRRLCDFEDKMLGDGNIVILSGVRTPIGRFHGSLSSKSAVELGAIVIQQAIRAATIDPNEIDEVYMGHLLQAGCKQSPARQAAILGGCPVKTEATSVNKACASSLKAVTMAIQAIFSKTDNFVVAGGMESMSNAPFLINRTLPHLGPGKIDDSIQSDALQCSFNNIHMGECCENLAKRYEITRFEQDEYARESYVRAINAWENHIFDGEIVSVPVKDKTGNIVEVFKDEELEKYNPQKMSQLKPLFSPDGTITAANASSISDGASALVITSKQESNRLALKPLAKILAISDAACDPIDFGLAPVHAIRKVLARSDLNINDISLFEINEAYSVVPLVCMRELGIDHSKVNIHGGAVSLGHPVGASGARILTHLIHALEPHQVGIAAICNGGGAATAVAVVKCQL
ncbi:Acetyl-CoA acetyltransferase A, mitochondrial [Thelohanellus kitauei]|uniref:acetyl-CoA C-acetyltransferase n=1 Tax=Thelohanellus kitauei TaxID=669202 RepID=A0A0C2MPY2_THEKT|nr:Acetyl-CoA acetyltransferase A, mitochondrial [Thelohanellus kitauei]